jgi:hypothetical protein
MHYLQQIETIKQTVGKHDDEHDQYLFFALVKPESKYSGNFIKVGTCDNDFLNPEKTGLKNLTKAKYWVKLNQIEIISVIKINKPSYLKDKFKNQYNSFRYNGYYGNECFEYSDEMINNIIKFTNQELNHRNFKSYFNSELMSLSEKIKQVNKLKSNYNFYFFLFILNITLFLLILSYFVFKNYDLICDKYHTIINESNRKYIYEMIITESINIYNITINKMNYIYEMIIKESNLKYNIITKQSINIYNIIINTLNYIYEMIYYRYIIYRIIVSLIMNM